MIKILTLNTGSTSTKIGFFHDDYCIFKETIHHRDNNFINPANIGEQADFRARDVLDLLKGEGYSLDMEAIAVRGGLLRPLASGVYTVDELMVQDLSDCRYGFHASNLGAIMAFPMAKKYGIPIYTVDPVTVDEFDEMARYSGLEGVSRLSMSHALNMKAVARRTAAKMGKEYDKLNFVVVHLGSGISVSAHRQGRMIDVNNANNEGPFSVERCGTLPALALINICYNSGHSEKEMIKLVNSQGGLYSYLGTKDFRKAEKRAAAGETKAVNVIKALTYQVAKETGAMAAVLKGDVDRIILTGGMANSKILIGKITERVSFIAPIAVVPGEEELEALAAGVLRVFRREEKVKDYIDIGQKPTFVGKHSNED